MSYIAKTCPSCGSKDINENLKCEHCNTQLEREATAPDVLKVEVNPSVVVIDGDKKICPKCKVHNKEEVSFCVKCGFKLVIDCPLCGKSHHLGTEFCPVKGRSIKNHHIRARIKKIKDKMAPFEKEKKAKVLKPLKKNPLYESYLWKRNIRKWFSIIGFLGILPAACLFSGIVFLLLISAAAVIFEGNEEVLNILGTIIIVFSIILIPLTSLVLLFLYMTIIFKIIPKKQAEMIPDKELMEKNVNRYNEIVAYLNKLKKEIKSLINSMDKEENVKESDFEDKKLSLNEEPQVKLDLEILPVTLTGKRISTFDVTLPEWKWYGPDHIFGKLIITDKELLFLPDIAEKDRVKYLNLLLTDIKSVEPGNELLIYPSGIEIIMKDGKKHFIVIGVFKRGKVMKAIKEYI